MRTYDFAPLWRSSVGFDRLFDLINETQRLAHFRRPGRLLARRNQHYGAAEQANRCRRQGRAQGRPNA
jgi:hypothetical protein